MTSIPRPIRLMVVLLAGAVLLSACGDRFIAPAAVVDGRRITESELASELNILAPQDPIEGVQGGNAPGQPSPDAQAESSRKEVTRRVLTLLIEVNIAQSYADAHGISVSPAEVERALQETIRSVGGREAFDQELANRNLTLQGVRRSLEHQALFQKVQASVVARQGGAPGGAQSDQGNQIFQRWFQQQLAAASVEVNPRFGRFDPTTGEITPIRSTSG